MFWGLFGKRPNSGSEDSNCADSSSEDFNWQDFLLNGKGRIFYDPKSVVFTRDGTDFVALYLKLEGGKWELVCLEIDPEEDTEQFCNNIRSGKNEKINNVTLIAKKRY